MKAKELKIGDWVYAKVPITCEIMPCKIEKFNNDKVLAGLIWSHFDELSPIPITEEILEKNGWEKDDVQWVLFNLVIQYDKVDDNFTIYVHQDGECNYLTEIEYVHELQHILWALGMDDDLKI